MKKAFIWIGIILLSPILLFIILTFLLYLPPIQNWAVDKTTEIASQETGMQISVNHVSLSFPLDLSVEGVQVLQGKDTIADIRNVLLDVRLLPLINMKVVVDELELNQAKINTISLIPDLQIKGTLGKLAVASRGIDLNEGTVELNGAHISDADMTILLNDTAAIDTTTSEPLAWTIALDSITILRSHIDVHMPGDSMQVAIGIGHATAQHGNIDLLHSIYSIKSFEWIDGSADYHLPYEKPTEKGLDYNHIALNSLRLALDSIYFAAPNLSMKIRDAAFHEQSGLIIDKIAGTVMMDSTGLRIPSLLLSTPYSNIRTKADVDFSLMDSIQPGMFHLNLDASLGKQDLMLFMADMPERFCKQWPEWPLAIKGQMDGNMQKMDIEELEATLPTAFHAKVFGTACNLLDTDHLLAQLDLQAETYNLNFATAFVDPKIMKDYRIPNGIRINGMVKADGPRYTADLVAHEGKGFVKAKGWFNHQSMSYDADLVVNNLNVHHFMPKDSIYELSLSAKAKGYGTDFMKKTCWLEADAQLDHLRYGQLLIDSVSVTARLNNGHAKGKLCSNNQLFIGNLDIDALLDTKNIGATIGADISRLDLFAMHLSEDPLQIGLCGHLDIESDLDQRHHLTGRVSDIYISDSLHLYRSDDIGLTAHTEVDTTIFRLQTGDMIIKADASGGYRLLTDQFMALADSLMGQYHRRAIDQIAIKQTLPTVKLYITSGQDNPIVDLLRSSANTYFKEFDVNMTTSATDGINGDVNILSLNVDSTRIDTIRLHITESSRGLSFQSVVANNRRNPQFVFRSTLDGHIHEHGATAGLRFYDDRGELGVRLGATASMEENGIRVHLLPARPTIGYREFNLNNDNYLFLGRDLKLQAKVDLLADDGTGIKLYSEDQDSTMLQDITVSLYRFDLDKLTTSIPYVPHVSGILNGDFHLMMDKKQQISVSSDMQVGNMIYESSPIGNVSTEFVYMQREDETHALQATMFLEDREVLGLKGSYQNKGAGYLDATLSFLHTPMNIANGFVPDQLVGLEGFAEGNLSVKGATNKPIVNGELHLEDAYLLSIPYGMRLRFDNDIVKISNSKLLLEDFSMYAYNDNPLVMTGNIDFHDTDRITMNVRMRARDFQLINSKQKKESIAYGKAFVNFGALMSGPLDQLNVRGRLDVLGKTDLTYILLDSPISTGNEIEELVKFTDFSDSTQTVVRHPAPQGMKVNLSINIDEGTHVRCDLNADQSNYVDILGGGEMIMKYGNEGITMNGRYTVTSGQMKYSLPVIPLKTFTIQDGSYVEFTGDVMNPRLNITATERTKAPVTQDDGQQSRSVQFDCGVIITKTLNDMGLEFIISAPEDMSITSELNAMTTEQRGKLAVTMLTTGMYLADGNTGGFSMNSALNSFLQGEINNITGSALKTLDVSIGMDNNTDATGNSRTDYSFKFAKRFWNNRLNVQVGGKVSTGTEMQGQRQSFFDNVSMEYRLTPTSNQYAKLFYNQNVYDWLEGYTGQYGAGYMWKRKLNSIWEIFKLWGNSTTTGTMPMSTRREQRDSIGSRPIREERKDSTNIEKR